MHAEHVGSFSGQAACILDAAGRLVNVSPSLARFFGCTADSLLGTSLLARLDGGEQVGNLLPHVQGRCTFQVRLRGPAAVQWVALSLLPGGVDERGPLVVACFESPDMPR